MRYVSASFSGYSRRCTAVFEFGARPRIKELYGGRSYPVRIRGIYVWNARFWIRWFYQLVRLMLRPTVRQWTRLCGDLSGLLSVTAEEDWSNRDIPASWGGSADEDNFWSRVEAKLRERYRNAARFFLEEQK